MPELPEWRPLDQIPETLSEGQQGRVVGIVAAEAAVEAGWAEEAALAVAKAWVDAGRKVMLVDGSLQRPSLHVATGIPNAEGLSDATLFGASIERVARLVEGEGYFLIPAGTAVADTNVVVRSRRWDQLAKSSIEAGVTLGVYLRDGESGTAAFLGSASDIVVLSDDSERVPASLRDLVGLVSLVTGPGDRVTGPPAGAAPPPAESEISAEALRKTAKEGRSRLVVLGVVTVVLVVVLLAIFGVIPVLGLSPELADDAVRAVGASTLPVR